MGTHMSPLHWRREGRFELPFTVYDIKADVELLFMTGGPGIGIGESYPFCNQGSKNRTEPAGSIGRTVNRCQVRSGLHLETANKKTARKPFNQTKTGRSNRTGPGRFSGKALHDVCLILFFDSSLFIPSTSQISNFCHKETLAAAPALFTPPTTVPPPSAASPSRAAVQPFSLPHLLSLPVKPPSMPLRCHCPFSYLVGVFVLIGFFNEGYFEWLIMMRCYEGVN
ncbi:hypothetical protein PIB30_000511 [Stylosanthes scabra]|uniref:Uncharacterized protein n=1 Tax=Stylosanthes scabra TaxID=79078 RepID=A0ABU6W227_9FABA|nr:hypothetical protein [Stylosanthes scabra]